MIRRHLLPLACVAVISLAAISSAAAGHRSPAPADIPAALKTQPLKRLLNSVLPARAALRAQLGMPALTVDPAAKRSKNKWPMVKPFVVSAAVDGDRLYTLQTTRSVSQLQVFLAFLAPLPLKLERTDLTTGVKTTIFNSKRTVVFGLIARGGRVAMSGVRLGGGKRSVTIDTQVYATAGPDAELKVVDSQAARVGRSEAICGSIDLLSSISDTGEIVINRLAGMCGKRGVFSSSAVAYAPDGSFRELLKPAGVGSLLESPDRLNGTKLLHSGLATNGLESIDLTTGQVSRYWSSNVPASSDVAPDGSVALVPNFDEESYYDEPKGDTGSGPTGGGEATPPPVPGRGQGKSKTPLIVFPQGNADDPRIVLPSSGDMTVKYCGSTLYAIRTLRKAERDDFEDLSLGDSFFFFEELNPAIRLRIAAVDSATRSIRTITTTKRMFVNAIGCSGESLAIAQGRTLKQSVLRYGP